MDDSLTIRDDPQGHRYLAHYENSAAADATAVAQYSLDGDVITFEHTRVSPEMEGHGVGARLVKFALDDTRARGRRVVAKCPFVAAYIERHPEYGPLLVTPGARV